MSDGIRLPELTFVTPAWNEREDLEPLLPDLRETLEDLGVRWEIIVSDGESRDGTPEAAMGRGPRAIHQQRPGYGAAIMEAIGASRAGYGRTIIHGTPEYRRWL